MSLKLDKDNPLATKVQTRDGRPARIICTNRKGEFPIIALITEADGLESYLAYTADGFLWSNKSPHSSDLINVPVKHVWWLNIYNGPTCGTLQPTKELADLNSLSNYYNRIACIKVSFTEGEGLEGKA